MKTKETSPKQIYITVVTSGLTMLANKVARALKPNEDIFDACSELANDIAKENGLDYSNVLVQYFNHYSDKIPAMALKVPSSPFHARRRKALTWWNNQGQGRQNYLTNTYIGGQRFSYSLTGSEIEKIWLKETAERGITITDISKQNQKQFKKFDESLFKAYINKFSDEDKFKCLILILNELSEEVQFNAFLATLRKMKLDSQIESNIMTLVALKDI